MKHILVLGPKNDLSTQRFVHFLSEKNISFTQCFHLSEINFSISNDRNGNFEIKLKIDGICLSEKTSIFIRNPYELLYTEKEKSNENFFIAQEYFSSLWAICSIFKGVVINRPDLLAWQHAQQLKTEINSYYIQDIWFSNKKDFLNKWRSGKKLEAHIENTNTWNKFILKRASDLFSELNHSEDRNAYRAILLPSAKYIIEIFVGDKNFLLLNETEFDVNSHQYTSLLKNISEKMSKKGAYFFAVVFAVDSEEIKIIRVIDNPPFHWYCQIEDDVHQSILIELQK